LAGDSQFNENAVEKTIARSAILIRPYLPGCNGTG